MAKVKQWVQQLEDSAIAKGLLNKPSLQDSYVAKGLLKKTPAPQQVPVPPTSYETLKQEAWNKLAGQQNLSQQQYLNHLHAYVQQQKAAVAAQKITNIYTTAGTGQFPYTHTADSTDDSYYLDDFTLKPAVKKEPERPRPTKRVRVINTGKWSEKKGYRRFIFTHRDPHDTGSELTAYAAAQGFKWPTDDQAEAHFNPEQEDRFTCVITEEFA